MRVHITTQVSADLATVKAGFDQELFLKLNPPFPSVKLLRFDGCKTGDWVELLLDFKFSKQKWVSEITFDNENDQVFEFVDEGREMPFPFSYWRHHHHMKTSGSGCLITDSIEYQAKNKFLTFLVYPILKLQFLYRKPIYRRVFRQN